MHSESNHFSPFLLLSPCSVPLSSVICIGNSFVAGFPASNTWPLHSFQSSSQMIFTTSVRTYIFSAQNLLWFLFLKVLTITWLPFIAPTLSTIFALLLPFSKLASSLLAVYVGLRRGCSFCLECSSPDIQLVLLIPPSIAHTQWGLKWPLYLQKNSHLHSGTYQSSLFFYVFLMVPFNTLYNFLILCLFSATSKRNVRSNRAGSFVCFVHRGKPGI